VENEAARLRALAAHCRHIAETLSSERNAETLRMMAGEFEASADACERLPLIKARPIPGRSG
jgi:hypothetical protein